LEEYYGVRLFDRLGKRVALTQAGEILCRRSESIFGMIEQVKVELDELQGLDRGALTVGSSITLGVYVLPEILGRFRAAYSHIDISLDITMIKQVVENVLANRVDVGFLGAPVEDEQSKMEAFMEDELVLIVPGAHRWARRDAVEAHDLLGETFIYPRRGSGTRDVIEKRLAAAEVILRNSFVNDRHNGATDFRRNGASEKG
jgi:DNA-binding transcriptional LysR family regulator